MSQVHTSYKVSKMLKEFLGESAPEPMVKEYWCKCFVRAKAKSYLILAQDCYFDGEYTCCEKKVPAYQLHDLLSKEFCEAFAEKKLCSPWVLARVVMEKYYCKNGLPAVEKALCEMMEAK